MVSVGQQAFIGLGAYGTIFLTQHGVPPYLAMVLAAHRRGVLALPLSVLVLRLRGGQFAIGTWVVAETLALLVALDTSLGGGTGISLTGLNVYEPTERQTGYTYWLTLGLRRRRARSSLLLLRSRHGAVAPGDPRRRGGRGLGRRPGAPAASCCCSCSPRSAAARPAR